MSNLDPRKEWNIAAHQKEFRLLSASEVAAQPDMKWAVEGVLPASGLACIYGPSGVGKSFLCLDLAAAIAEGQPWFGHKTERSRVVFLALEGQAGIRNRIAAWKAYHGREYPQNVLFSFGDFEINTTTDPASLLQEIDHQGGAKVIIVDTLNRAMHGADENASLSMGQVILGAMILQRGLDGLVGFVHHPGKDVSKKLRGHSSLYAALDAILEVKAEGASIVWRTIKSKDGEANVRHSFELKAVEFLNKAGRSLTSCVVAERGSGTDTERAKPKGANQIEVDRAVSKMLFEHRITAVAEGHLEGPALGLPLEVVREAVSGLLVSVEAKRRRERAKDALDGLIAKGRFILTDEMLTLAPQDKQMGGE